MPTSRDSSPATRDRQLAPSYASDRACAIDAAAVLAVGAAICVASHRPVVMTLVVAAVLALRVVAWVRLPAAERGRGLPAELLFLALCTILGAGNDWNSVVRHRIYDYTVPDLSGAVGQIPLWMLLYWGIILRFVATLCRWQRLGPPATPASAVRIGGWVVSSPWLKVAGLIALAVTTRQMIYVHYLHPVHSWLPFAVALVVYALVFGLDTHARRLVLMAAIVGPLVEIVFIQVGELHFYHLGWVAGVPLWIVLWWMLAVLIWNDLSTRLLAFGVARPHGGEDAVTRPGA